MRVLEEESRLWNVRMTIVRRGIERHESDVGRVPYDDAFAELIREGMKYASHVWKPHVYWYMTHYRGSK